MAVKNRRALELKMGKLGVALFVSGMSAALLAAFLFGVLVGEHLDAWPERYSGGLADLVRDRMSGLALAEQKEKTASPDEKMAPKGADPAGKDDFNLTFYDVLGDKKNHGMDSGAELFPENGNNTVGAVPVAAAGSGLPVAGVAVALPSGKNPPAASQKPAAHPPVRDAVTPVLPSRMTGSTTEKPSETVPSPASASSDNKVKQNGFHVQAAAFTDIKQAEKMVARLKKIGFAASIVPRDIPNKGRWFRVIVGGFEDRNKAELAVSRIAGKIKGVKCIIRQHQG
jgi:cell division septation protein DedD